MKKTISLLKAVLSQDMNLFKYTAKKNASKTKKLLFPIFLFALISFSIGTYAYMIAEPLYEMHLTYVMLTLFLTMVSILTFMSGIYKSQNILFDCKDNDLLFSLPIKKSKILFIRIFKLLLFQFVYNLMFLLPAFAIYVYFVKPNVGFYLISLVMSILIPIIPTVLSSFIGYIVKLFSSKSNKSKIVQTLLTSLIFLVIFFFSFNLENYINNIVEHATDINDLLIKIYYPIGLYVRLITNFSFIDFIKLISVNIIPLLIFILLGSKFYFKIISNNKNSKHKTKINNKKDEYKKHSKLYSLAKKELKRFVSSPVYMFNSSFGLIILLISTIAVSIKGDYIFKLILSSYGINDDISINILYYGLIIFSLAMTSITSSSISLEGKTINITKSLPISIKEIIISKIIYPYVIELPFVVISELIYLIIYKPSVSFSIALILVSILLIFFTAAFGLLINLKYPKMNASSDTEVVKQSMSSMISVFSGMGIFIMSLVYISSLINIFGFTITIYTHILILLLLDILVYIILKTTSQKDYANINV